VDDFDPSRIIAACRDPTSPDADLGLMIAAFGPCP